MTILCSSNTKKIKSGIKCERQKRDVTEGVSLIRKTL